MLMWVREGVRLGGERIVEKEWFVEEGVVFEVVVLGKLHHRNCLFKFYNQFHTIVPIFL